MSGIAGDHDPAGLWPELLAHASEMQFFRFCELLERSAPQRPLLGSTDSLRHEPVRFRSKWQVGFPGREIDAVETDSDHATSLPTVRTTFLGLYGVDARMPSYFIDEMAQNREGADALAAFLDLFHHRTVTQYFRIWRKYRYPVGFKADGSDPTSSYLLSLVGLGLGSGASRSGLQPRKLLSMLGLANQKTRTAEGLAGVLQQAVPDAVITVDEFHPVWVAVDAAEPMPLGEHCVLGGGFFDRANCVQVVIRPNSAALVHQLMPGQAMYQQVMTWLRFYLGYAAQALITMRISAGLLPPPQLASQAGSLGYSTLLPPPAHSVPSAEPWFQVRLGSWNIPTRQ